MIVVLDPPNMERACGGGSERQAKRATLACMPTLGGGETQQPKSVAKALPDIPAFLHLHGVVRKRFNGNVNLPFVFARVPCALLMHIFFCLFSWKERIR